MSWVDLSVSFQYISYGVTSYKYLTLSASNFFFSVGTFRSTSEVDPRPLRVNSAIITLKFSHPDYICHNVIKYFYSF